MIQKLFEVYSEYIWPIQRHFTNKLTLRCKNCALSSHHTPLDQAGLCTFCVEYAQQPMHQDAAQLEDQSLGLKEFLAPYCDESPERSYDALVLLSGGKDSAYILHRLQQEFADLRILTVMVDNGFTSPVALSNAEFVANKLGVDFLLLRSHVQQFRQNLRQAFADLNGKSAYGAIDYVDGTMIFDAAKKLANDFHIPLMISGLSWAQLEQIAGIENSFTQTHDHIKLVEVFPLCAWKTEEHAVRKYVQDKALIPKGKDSPVVTNSDLILPMCVVDILNLGYCSFEPEFSQMIREGKALKEQWRNTFELLEYGVKTGRLVSEANKTLRKIDLSIDEVIGGT
ncbi:MAG: 3'-phosphoadenosine 5'-phosphosulfate sulfotransferase (PAPS reductase)/FAD synthetase [Gammaproteobacteria bacterium]|jgi:3'-phosphoadenosine 5'-phosphosulfate sulfotransferase (PAPS reductase)/FAD synthetase